MGSCWEFIPLPQLSLPKRVIVRNWRLNVVFYLAHLPILLYAVVFFFLNMQYTQEIPNNPFTLIELDQVDMEPFLSYTLRSDPSEQVIAFCEDAAAGLFSANCSDSASAEICENMFGSLLAAPYSIQVRFFCTTVCLKMNDPRCFVPTAALVSQGSQQVQLVIGRTEDAGGTLPPPGSVRVVVHSTNPMLRNTVLVFRYSFRLAQPAPYLLGMEDPGLRKTNNDASTIIVDSHDIVKRLFTPGEVINYTMAEIVQAAGAVWNYTMIFQGSEFTVVTNCFTAERDLPPSLYWAQIPKHEASEGKPLCIMKFTWLQEKSVSYSVDGGFGRDVWLRLKAESGSSFSRLPSLQATMLNLVSLVVLLSIPPAITGVIARTFLGTLSKIYRQVTNEYFDLPMNLATAGLKAIANVSIFGNLASTTMTKDELRTCLREVLTVSKQSLRDRDLDRLTNFVFETDPRYPHGPRKKPPKADKDDEPRVDAARFALSTTSNDSITVQDLGRIFDSSRDRALVERLFTPPRISQALKDQRGLELPTWKKELLGVEEEMDHQDILGEAEETTTPRVISEASQRLAEEESPEALETLVEVERPRLDSDRSCVEEVHDELADRVKLVEESLEEKGSRLERLEKRNEVLAKENSELKKDLAELKLNQVQLASRCDQQLQEMMDLLRRLQDAPQEASQLPKSSFSASTSFQRPSARS